MKRFVPCVFPGNAVVGCVLLATLVLPRAASDAPPIDRLGAESTGNIRVLADCCAFRGDSLAGLVEVYIQTYLDGITFVEEENGSVRAEIGYEAFLVGQKGRTTLREWTMPVRLGGAHDAVRPGLALYDKLDLAVKPGAYDLELEIRDLNGTHRGRLSLRVVARDLSGEGPSLSDLQLARSVTRSPEGDDLWTKSGYRVLPNPSRRYGEAQPVLQCYAEAYGLRSVAEGGEFCTVLYEVEDVEGKNVYTKGPFLMRRMGESAVLVGDIDVRDLAPGYYRLSVSLEDTIAYSRLNGPRSSAIFIRAEDTVAGAPRGLSAAESTAAEIELRFVGTPADARQFRELSPVGRALFLERFWQGRDPDPSTQANEARADLHARIALAQSRFRETGRDGIDTDRGRVFIKFGPPTEISRESGELTCKDHEIWSYRKEREYEFVFFDETGAGSYRLIHSNYPGEVSRPEWRDIVCEKSRVQMF